MGIIIGLLVGFGVMAILWNEPFTWRTFIRYEIAAVSLVIAMLLAGGRQ